MLNFKSMNTKTIFTIAIIFFAVSCTKEIELELPEYSSKLVVNGEMNTESEISLQISRSLPIMNTSDSSGYLIQNAIVEVFENGTSVGTATYFSGRYVLPYKPKAGLTYKVNVKSGNYIPAEANLVIPKALPVTLTYIDSVGLDEFGFKIGRITLNFSDDGSVSNYYKLLIRYYNSGTTAWFPFSLNSNDIIFLNNEMLNDGGYLFSDRTFSGKSKTLSFPVPFGLAKGTPKFEVSLKSFNTDYYDYLRATDDYTQTGNGFSNDPVILKTNVTNGLGMVGGVSNVRDTIF